MLNERRPLKGVTLIDLRGRLRLAFGGPTIMRRLIATATATALLVAMTISVLAQAPAQASGPACYERRDWHLSVSGWVEAQVWVDECWEHSSHWFEMSGWVQDTGWDGLTAYIDIWNSYNNDRATYSADGYGKYTNFYKLFASAPYGLFARIRACSGLAGCSNEDRESYYP